MPKYIFVTGGVLSSLGKGLAASSIGALMEARGLRVTHQKFDPYINVDPGTMNPLQHGEVYVTDDGAETDLDLGHYERFTSAVMTKNNNFTTGQIYNSVITKERQGEYLGGTVQVIPHITDEIKSCFAKVADGVDIVICEIGGTVGDIESLPFLEAIRQFRKDAGPGNLIYVHVTLVPYVRAAGELKTKPTQHSVKELRAIGIQPNILLCRTEIDIPRSMKAKIALFCDVDEEAVITVKDVESVYELPLFLHREGLDDQVVKMLNIWTRQPELSRWEKLCDRIKNPTATTKIAVVGKYIDLQESYKSLTEALRHGGYGQRIKVVVDWVDAEAVAREGGEALLAGADGILVPGGFGERGIEGKIRAVQWAREQRIPFFGICLGMQCAVIEHARNSCGLAGANSSEFNAASPHPVIDLMAEQVQVRQKGGTMRLGAYPCVVKRGTKAYAAYRKEEISERHRHRYEVNNLYRQRLEEGGLVLSGTSPDGALVEMVELPDHPWFVGCQFHPEFKSKPLAPHPLFREFVRAAAGCRREEC
jgi:CTP synthase